MNPEVKEAWITALTSGEYKQGQRALCTLEDDGSKTWCCLGVLCDLAAKAGVQMAMGEAQVPVTMFADETRNVVLYNDDGGYPPSVVVEWAGLSSANPPVPGTSFGMTFDTTLASMNDNGEPFTAIADAIRTHL